MTKCAAHLGLFAQISRRHGENADTKLISKLSDSEGEAAETRVWLEFAWRCGYMKMEDVEDLDKTYDTILGQLVKMITEADKWILR